VNNRTIVLLIFVDAFVAFVWFRVHQQGMPLPRVILLAAVSCALVNLAAILGIKLGEIRTRQIVERRARRK
jgi:hypothetical protein